MSASVQRSSSTAVCEACGMEVNKADISTFRIVAADGSEHWACCPICAEEIGLYYANSEIYAKCFSTGKAIKLTIVDGNLASASVTPADPSDDVRVLLGGSCATNKIVSNALLCEQVRQAYAWASNAPLKTLPESFAVAKNKLVQMTVSYKPVSVPTLNYVMMGVGAAFLVASPIAWKLGKKGAEA
ncbi:MAG: hypothetical protein ACE14S_02160 [Candidatus Bathyarchaeia archaeon]